MAIGDIFVAKIVTSLLPRADRRVVAFNLVHYVVSDEQGAGASRKQIVDTYAAAIAVPYKAIFDTEARFEGVLFQKVWPLPAEEAVSNNAVAGPGIRAAGEKMPTQICGIITKRTGGIGRRKRGRVYVPFPLEDDGGPDNLVSVNYATLLNGIGADLVLQRTYGGGGNTTTMKCCIFHAPPAPAPNFTEVTAMQTRSYWATQRRRSAAFRSDILPIFPL